MEAMIGNAFSLFFLILEGVLFFYVFITWFPISVEWREKISFFVDPILEPIRFLLKHSIFQVSYSDLSPLIGFLIVSYLQQFFASFK